MKNIYLLSTEKRSRLQLNKYDKLFLSEEVKSYLDCINQEVYITSDETIGENELCLQIHKTNNKVPVNIVEYKNYGEGSFYFKKIILTTDPLLIEHGVQKIDDEFLEWFVKNSGCEFVEVNDITTIPALQLGSPNGHLMYKIVIPEWISPMQKFTKKKNIIDTWLEKNGDPTVEKHVELELAANEYANLVNDEDGTSDIDFIEGANWMAERMYSEDEILKLLMECSEWQLPQTEEDVDKIKHWFENNKKK